MRCSVAAKRAWIVSHPLNFFACDKDLRLVLSIKLAAQQVLVVVLQKAISKIKDPRSEGKGPPVVGPNELIFWPLLQLFCRSAGARIEAL